MVFRLNQLILMIECLLFLCLEIGSGKTKIVINGLWWEAGLTGKRQQRRRDLAHRVREKLVLMV